MKQTLFVATVLSSLLLQFGCTSAPAVPPDTSAADLKAIGDLLASQAKDFTDKAFDKLPSYYAEDATLMTTGAPPSVGKQAIGEMTKMLSQTDADLKLQVAKTEVAKSGDIGYAQGTYTIASTDPKTKKRMLEKGTWVNVFKKQTDGSWKVVEDINTPDSDPVEVAATTASKDKL
jgi:uncharacterized protein (TIGR02246 family)